MRPGMMTPKRAMSMGQTISKSAKVDFLLTENNATNRQQRRRLEKEKKRQLKQKVAT